MHRSELVNWYLKEIESDIDSEEELVKKKNLCEKIIYRLVSHVSMKTPCYVSNINSCFSLICTLI